MADYNDVVRLAVDAYHGNVEKYSVAQSMDVLRQALVDANGGSTKLNYKSIRDGKCTGLFSIIEQIIDRTIVEGLTENDYFNALVDFRNVALGDLNEFVVENSTLFFVSEAAEGTQGIRRQRIDGYSTIQVPTTLKVVKIYDELNRVLAGQIDFNKMIDRVGASMKQRLLEDTYKLWTNATAADLGGSAYFPAAGTYDEDTMLDVVTHVEAAANGKPATILGTAKGLRNLVPGSGALSNEAENDMYTTGFYGYFYGTKMVRIPQRHKANSTNFVFDDNTLIVIAGDDKPIKCVREGDPLIIQGDPLNRADLTVEYLLGDRYGMGLVVAGGNAGIGKYVIQQ